MIVSVVDGVERAREYIAAAAHLLGREDVNEFPVVLEMVCLSHLAESGFNNLLVFVSFNSFDRQLATRKPAKSIAHYGTFSKVILFLLSSHF